MGAGLIFINFNNKNYEFRKPGIKRRKTNF